jgi:hypothetical protein
MNDDASTFELPEYIHSRLQPQIHIDFPERDEELLILKSNLPFADEEILEYVVEFLQTAHDADERYSVRDGINIARYALKRLTEGNSRLPSGAWKEKVKESLKRSASMILDDTASRFFTEIIGNKGNEE